MLGGARIGCRRSMLGADVAVRWQSEDQRAPDRAAGTAVDLGTG
jgi:hypothetical protein